MTMYIEVGFKPTLFKARGYAELNIFRLVNYLEREVYGCYHGRTRTFRDRQSVNGRLEYIVSYDLWCVRFVILWAHWCY